MTRPKKILWIALFMLLIAAPWLVYPFAAPYLDTANHENRSAAPLPALSLETLEAFPAAFEAYFNDRIPFRNQLVRLNADISRYVFGESGSDQVLTGKNGWLFYCSKEDYNPVAQSLGQWLFSKEELEQIAENVTLMKRVCESQGMEFVFFIAPNKETIYREEIPNDFRRVSETTSADQLAAYLAENTDVTVQYPKRALLDAKETNPDIVFYHKLDTHWNAAGAYIGSQCFAGALGIELPAFETLQMRAFTESTGDLTQMLNIEVSDGCVDYALEGNGFTFVHKEEPAGTVVCRAPGRRDERRLFVVRDSFADAMIPVLASQFRQSCWVMRNNFQQPALFSYDADIFAYEAVERYLPLLKEPRLSFIKISSDGAEAGASARIASAVPDARGYTLSVYQTDAEGKRALAEGVPLSQGFAFTGDQAGSIEIEVYDAQGILAETRRIESKE